MHLSSPSTESLGPHQQLRILVVDDDEVDRLRITRMLQRAPGWQVAIDTAVDKAAGLAALRSRAYDCVLLDFRLPDGDGLELLREIRAATGDCPPVVMQTTLEHGETALQTIAAGAQDYLVKGRFEVDMLCRTIRYAIERDRLVKERNRLTHELQASLERLKTLEGLLPTCAWCGRIRDEAGNWGPLEGYIESHTQAQFSHGICPECMSKYSQDHQLGPAEGPGAG